MGRVAGSCSRAAEVNTAHKALLATLLAATPSSLPGPRQAKLRLDLQHQCKDLLASSLVGVQQRREAEVRAKLTDAARQALAGFKVAVHSLSSCGVTDEGQAKEACEVAAFAALDALEEVFVELSVLEDASTAAIAKGVYGTLAGDIHSWACTVRDSVRRSAAAERERKEAAAAVERERRRVAEEQARLRAQLQEQQEESDRLRREREAERARLNEILRQAQQASYLRPNDYYNNGGGCYQPCRPSHYPSPYYVEDDDEDRGSRSCSSSRRHESRQTGGRRVGITRAGDPCQNCLRGYNCRQNHASYEYM
ncbi:hypothetical protein COO60DRAFT_421117 [Scenedesmus sp. NREL 46B-D3]|nr:hypothetical protein COO60DRAFT_421117 [Scenedesmus sp. NREL 46B-D3]